MVAAAERLRIALAETGLSSDRLIPPSGVNKEAPQGGPLVPVQFGPDSSPFGREFARMREAAAAHRTLCPVAQAALRRP